MSRLTICAAFAAFLAVPALAQDAETPVIPAPEAQPAPQATETNVPTEMPTIIPARKSNCSRDKHVMS